MFWLSIIYIDDVRMEKLVPKWVIIELIFVLLLKKS